MRSKGDTPVPTSRVPAIQLEAEGTAALLRVFGSINEDFKGFGSIPESVNALVIDVSAMTDMSSYGVRQWLDAMHELPSYLQDIYLLACPTFFVDNLNMVMSFGARAKVLTIAGPYVCPSCGHEATEMIDVYSERAKLMDQRVSSKKCSACGGELEFDEPVASFFAFVEKSAATTISKAATDLLASKGLYRAPGRSGEPPKITRLVHEAVNYFRIKGSINSMFRGRPLLAGAEGEVVIDLAEVRAFEPDGQAEWDRLIAALVKHVQSVVLVDLGAPILKAARAGSFRFPAKCVIWSILVPYVCRECQREFNESLRISGQRRPLEAKPVICDLCGGQAGPTISAEDLQALRPADLLPPPASEAVITRRAELLSRAAVEDSVRRSSPPVADDDAILGKYKIVRKLSSGGMAEVFLAKQIGIGGFEKPVALKRILRSLLEKKHKAVHLFLNEAKLSARLNHPNIVHVLDVAEVQGALYIAMEYVDGRDLSAVFGSLQQRGEWLGYEEALHIARAVASALHYAHFSTDLDGNQLRVIHRDLSPHNVLLGFDGSVRLADFGVATSSVTSATNTMPTIAGKWTYMAPEQTTGAALDHRTDLFALGILLYEMCTGHIPFKGHSSRETAALICRGAYRPLEEVAPHLPDSLANLIDQLLQVKPERRPASGNAVAVAIDEIAHAMGISLSPAITADTMLRLFSATQPHIDAVEHVSTTIDFDPNISPLSHGSFEEVARSIQELPDEPGELPMEPTRVHRAEWLEPPEERTLDTQPRFPVAKLPPPPPAAASTPSKPGMPLPPVRPPLGSFHTDAPPRTATPLPTRSVAAAPPQHRTFIPASAVKSRAPVFLWTIGVLAILAVLAAGVVVYFS
jgi:eukaryotic-like serine/threonine-protein kinase